MPINIKSEEVSALAVELAAKTGETLTAAVGTAVRNRLAELEDSEKRKGMAKRLLAIGRKSASAAPKDWLERDFDAELYDDAGMPK